MNIVRLAAIFNEADIIRQNLEWYIRDGFQTIIIDEGSTDGTYEICRDYLGKGIIHLEQKSAPAEHNRITSVKYLWNIMCKYSADYVLLADADEFFESPKNESFRLALEEQFLQGYNLINFNSMEFWMTDKDDSGEQDPLRRIKHYSFFSNHLYRAFKFDPHIDIWTKLGHAPIFPSNMEPRISPKKFICRHYKFRSLEQAYRKIARIKPPSTRKDQSFHYIKFRPSPEFFIIPSKFLSEYLEDQNWNLSRTFSGGRMTRKETMEYLGLKSEKEFDNFLKSRSF